MAVLPRNVPAPTLIEAVPAADPAPLGLAAFALTTFMLSGHNATFIPDVALGRPGAVLRRRSVQLLAGHVGVPEPQRLRRDARSRRTAGSGSRSEPSSSWPRRRSSARTLEPADVNNALAWFLLAFAIFNTYMLMRSTRVNVAVFAVFVTLEITEILLAIGFFRRRARHEPVPAPRGRLGRDRRPPRVAWYTSAAGVVNGMSPERRSCRSANRLGPPAGALARGVADAAADGG